MSLRALLRQATAGEHASLEEFVGAISSLAQYKRYVSGICAFRIPFEEVLVRSDWPAWFGTWRPQWLGPALMLDAGDLNLTPARPVEAPLDISAESLLGMLYVLEGSSLGARLIYRSVSALGFSSDFGARHLALQSGDPHHWTGFLALLQQDEAIDREAVVAAARRTFGAAKLAFANYSAE